MWDLFLIIIRKSSNLNISTISDLMISVFVSQPKILKPKAVLFRHSYMTSVLAVRQRGWMVFFIGTGDGQLIKVCMK